MEKHFEEKLKQNHETLIKVLEECPEIVLVGTENDILRTPTKQVSFEHRCRRKRRTQSSSF